MIKGLSLLGGTTVARAAAATTAPALTDAELLLVVEGPEYLERQAMRKLAPIYKMACDSFLGLQAVEKTRDDALRHMDPTSESTKRMEMFSLALTRCRHGLGDVVRAIPAPIYEAWTKELSTGATPCHEN